MGDAPSERPLETGWLPDTPIDDSLLRRFLFNQARVNATIAGALGGRSERTTGVMLSDSGTRVPYFNQAIVTRPIGDPNDAVLDQIEGYFEGGNRGATLLSIWPTPDLGARGWTLVGHPMMVARGSSPHAHEHAAGVRVEPARSPSDFADAERVAVEGYPIDEAAGLPTHGLFPPELADSGLVVRVGYLDDTPVGVGLCFVGEGVVNLCLGATLPAARRRGVWEALVWARVADAPQLPAVAYTSDHSRPGFERMGFMPLLRFTLWAR